MLEAVTKVVTTMTDYESVYIDNLRLLVEKYASPVQAWGLLEEDELNTIFGNIREIYKASQAFFESLRSIKCSDSQLEKLPERDRKSVV